MRLLFGIFTAGAFPPAVGLLRDFFPPSLRSTANVVQSSSLYVGACLASLSVLLIEKVGWQEDYQIFGAFGVISGVALLTFVKEPERG